MLDLELPEQRGARLPVARTGKEKSYYQYRREAKHSYKRIMKKYGAKVYKSSIDVIQLPSETLYFNGQAYSREQDSQ